MSKRIALIIGNNTYQDIKLSRLNTPDVGDCVHELAFVLQDPAIGNFDLVETIINQPSHEIRPQISDLFHWKKKNDMLLLYVVGHAVLDEAGQLYLATADTVTDSLEETAVSAAYINVCMDRSFSRQQILILDCFHSTPLVPGAKHGLDASVGTAAAFRGKGYGRLVVAASDEIQYILETDKVIGNATESVFTQYLIQGLRTGMADTDEDGQIGINELFEYVYRQVDRHTVSQKPCMWPYNEHDKFIIALNPKKVEPEPPIKWDLIFGAIMAPTATLVIGITADLGASVGMAGLFLLLYTVLYMVLD